MVKKCFYCQATDVELAHIKSCAESKHAAKKTLITATPVALPQGTLVTAVKVTPAHRAIVAKMKADAKAADAAKVQIMTPVVDDTTDANGYLLAVAPVAPTKVKPQDMEIGFYFMNGDAYKIVWNKSETMKYAMKLFVQKTWGKNGQTYKGKWGYVSGAIYDLQPEHKMTKEIADQYAATTLEKYGVSFCGICGKKLTAKESVAKGIGPVCSSKI